MEREQTIFYSSLLKKNITWHAIEAFGYHVCLLAHHILFFLIAPREIYGTIGTLFSCIYLATTLLHLGILDTLAIFFADYSRSQNTTRMFLIKQLTYNAYAFGIFICVMITVAPRALPSIFSPTVILLTLLATFFESIKKISKRLLRLANMTPIVTGTSIFSILVFMAMVWVPFYCFHIQIYTHAVLICLTIMGALEAAINGYYLHQWYAGLPQEDTPSDFMSRVFYNQRNAFLVDIGKLATSGNVLVPFLAATKGVHDAALLKLSSSLVHNLIAVIDKVIDRTSTVMLARTKYTQLKDNYATVFTLSTWYNALLCIVLSLFIWYRSYNSFTLFGASFILYYVLQLLQKTHIPYTKMRIIQEQPFIVMVIIAFQVICTLSLLQVTNSQITILLSLIAISFFQYLILLGTADQTKQPRYVGILATLLVIFLLQNILL